jgi:hypothetical protein
MGLIVPEQQEIVWPLQDSAMDWACTSRPLLAGLILEPLAPWVSALALLDERFSWYMSLVECLRVGRARERAWASQQFGLLWGDAA